MYKRYYLEDEIIFQATLPRYHFQTKNVSEMQRKRKIYHKLYFLLNKFSGDIFGYYLNLFANYVSWFSENMII